MKKVLYNILLIAPKASLAQEISEWLSDKASIVYVSEHREALQKASLDEWDLVITNLNSEKVNDLEITQVVKKVNPYTPIIIIAENIKVDFILTAMQHHADGLFFNPLDKEEFTQRVLQLAKDSKQKRQKEQKIVLAIGAHPDDVEFGCGGTLAKLRAEGAFINILTLSLGSVGGNPHIREQEAKTAAEMQGAVLYLGNLSDTKIMNSAKTIQFIEQIVQKINPTHVYTHSFYDSHQDHRNVFQATIIACRQTPNLYSYLSPSSTVEFKPNVFININEFIETKINFMKAFSSQMEIRPYLHPDMIRATARYWGRFCNYNLVEPMEVIKEHS